MLATPTTLDDFSSIMAIAAEAPAERIEFTTPPSDLDFDRPFWHMTTKALLDAHKAKELETASLSFADLREIVGSTTPAPTGMIFHIGRCGSTLVSRMAGHDRSRLVMREAGPIGSLHRASGGSDRVSTYTIEQAFKDLLVTLDRFAAARDQRTIIKHSSWESFSMGRIAEVLPDTPFVFVCRDPLETVRSSLDGHPGWAPRIHQPRGALQRWVPWLDRVEAPFTAATIYASVWAAGVDAALRLPPDRILFVDHARLTANPRGTLASLQAHLDLDLSIDGALDELNRYSKANDDDTEFDPEGKHAHPPLSAGTRRHVADVVGDLEEQLAARLGEQD